MTKLTGEDRQIADEVRYQYIEHAGYPNDKRTHRLVEPYLVGAVDICKQLNVSPAAYVKAVLAYQAPEGVGDGYLPYQVSPLNAKRFVLDYMATTGKRDLASLFNTQCRMLGLALENGIPDHLCLLNPSLDFMPWFRVLMTAEPNQKVIDTYGKEAKHRLEHDFELAKFLHDFEAKGVKLDLSRIPNYHYE